VFTEGGYGIKKVYIVLDLDIILLGCDSVAYHEKGELRWE